MVVVSDAVRRIGTVTRTYLYYRYLRLNSTSTCKRICSAFKNDCCVWRVQDNCISEQCPLVTPFSTSTSTPLPHPLRSGVVAASGVEQFLKFYSTPLVGVRH